MPGALWTWRVFFTQRQRATTSFRLRGANSKSTWWWAALAVAGLLSSIPAKLSAAEKFTVATYNLENYILEPSATRPVKSEQARAKIRESILAIHPDVLGLEEIGRPGDLEELRVSLKAGGLDYSHSEFVSGFDTNIHVAVLSRFPITSRHPHSQEGFLLNGRRFRITRGIAELDLQISPNYSLTLFVAHLKSKRPAPEADEEELREQEALVLRQLIDARLRGNPEINLVVVGDFNDVKDSRSTRAVLGKGKTALIDTRPSERNGDREVSGSRHSAARNISWTHFYAKEDTYSRLDYILVSRAMARKWDPAGTYVLALPNWGVASDHRPILAAFVAEDN